MATLPVPSVNKPARAEISTREEQSDESLRSLQPSLHEPVHWSCSPAKDFTLGMCAGARYRGSVLPTGVSDMAGARLGDTVSIHYVTSTLEGCVIESSHNREPFVFRLGDETVVPGLTDAILGRTVGEQARIVIPGDQAFGRQSDDLIQHVPPGVLPSTVSSGLSVGDQLAVTICGTTIPCRVQRITGDKAVLDANHPLAGETLFLDIEVVGIDSDLHSVDA